ncbi:hypothetical protein [Streptomyces lushanensis]|uniref:hypothetical protein n=1 Tax=Streptomyces lushanensis TaxID=1434255 RepID=UPI00114D0B8A|nr:hypothetical protein [Streptomyces lushanensis]
MAVVRAAVFTVTGVVLAVTGHHVVSGHPVPWRAVPPAAAALFALTLPAVRTSPSRPPSRSWPLPLPSVIAATGTAQLALHLWLVRVSAPGAPAPHGAAGHGAAHGTYEAWHAGRHGLSMTAAHVLAALLVAWFLQRADAACLAVCRSAGGVLGALLVRLLRRAPTRPFPSAPRVPRAVGTRAPPPSHGSPILAHAVVRRGPPPEHAPAL